MTLLCWDRITSYPSSIIITYLRPVISTCQNPSYWQMCCPLASVENVLAAEWLWIKPQSLQPLLPPNAFTFVAWQVNVSWLPSEIFLHHVWWKTFGKLAVVPCTLQFVVSIRSLSMKWEGRLQAKGKKNLKPRANQNMNSHFKKQAGNIFFCNKTIRNKPISS